MTSSESDYTARIKQDTIPKEKSVAAHNRRRFNIVVPNKITDNKEQVIDTETNAAGDEIDTSNNYTAAENDHNTNTTL